MSKGLYIPSEGSGGEFLPSAFRWPRGDKPYRRTIRAAFYRVHYQWPRWLLWLCVVLPPVLIVRALVPANIWTLAQVLVVDAALVGGACALAAVLDAALFGDIFDGQKHDPDSPALSKAEALAYEWRRQWKLFEASPVAHGRHFAGQMRFMLPSLTAQSVDLTPLVQGLGRDDFLRLASEATQLILEFNPGSVARSIEYNERPAVLLIAPVAWSPDVPEAATAHAWMVISEPDTAHPGAVQRLSTTYWFPGGKLPDGSTGPEDGTTAIGRISTFFDTTWVAPLLCTFFLWPVGMIWLAIAGWLELKHHDRYKQFLLLHSPSYGDSLDLWLIQAARSRRAEDFPRIPNELQQRLLSVSDQFRQVFSSIRSAATGRGRGNVR